MPTAHYTISTDKNIKYGWYVSMTKKQLGIIILMITTLIAACALIPITLSASGGIAVWLSCVLETVSFAVPTAWFVTGIVLVAKK